LVLAIAAVAGGAIVQGSVGVGLSLVAAPALVAIDPTFIPGPLLIVGQITAYATSSWRAGTSTGER